MKHSKQFESLVDDARGRIRECTIDDVHEKLERGHKFHLVDVREQDEWDAGHIPTAIHLSKGIIERDIVAEIPNPVHEAPMGNGRRSKYA